MARHIRTATVALLLTACAPHPPMPQVPRSADLSAETVRTRDGAQPTTPAGACWAADESPAVIETVTEQVQVSPEQRAPDGSLIAPAAYRTQTHTRLVSDRETVWLRTPCPSEVTPDFLASLQRALKARGYYLGPLTGQLDPATTDALRRFQSDHGLDSRQLSYGAARDLGLVATDIGAL